MDHKARDRFWSKVDRRADDECWPWRGGFGTSGAPVFSLDRSQVSGRAVMWELAHGRKPEHRLTTSCGCQECVNPAHLAEIGVDAVCGPGRYVVLMDTGKE